MPRFSWRPAAAGLTILGFLAILSPAAAAKPAPDNFVRTANYFLKAGTDITPEMYPALAKYDLLILPAEAQIYNRTMFGRLRQLNADIIILAYVPTKSWNEAWFDELHRALGAGIEDSWWLRDPAGNPVSVWPGTKVVSTASPWQTYLPRFVQERIMATGLWDGVFYDEFSSNVSWVNGGNLDLHRDGRRDDPALADTAWKRATINLLKYTRELLGPEAVIITNGDSTAELQSYVNGRMFESFPTPWEAGGSWSGVMKNYVRLHSMVGSAPIFVINATTGNTGDRENYQKVRFGLASTLLADGFFSFDFGDANHGQLWTYDEYAVQLGRPLGAAASVSPVKNALDPGVWRRDFEKGVALVNATAAPQTVALGRDFEKLRGSQDPEVNNGAIVDRVTIQPADGLVLLKPIEQIIGSTFSNGAFARVFDAKGGRKRNGFFTYQAGYQGSSKIIIKDVDGDGAVETVLAAGADIVILDANGERRRSFSPFGTAGFSIAAGDLDGDGRDEIVAGAGPGGLPRVRVFALDGSRRAEFLAFSAGFRGGVNVASANLYGNKFRSIVVGAGPGGGPHVRVFTMYGRVLLNGFFAYAPAFRGGVQVAAGDLDGDGKDEIVTGAGPGGGPHVRVFDRFGRSLGKGFFAAEAYKRDGVEVAVTDVDGDGIQEIAAMTQDVFRITTGNDF